MTAPLGDRFRTALLFANDLHAQQVRKGSGVPYIAHLLAVASLVLEHGGGEDEAVAALLHDAVEDQGGAAMAAEIERRFGPTVAATVVGCSDTDVVPKPPWQARKETYIAHVRGAEPAVCLVSAADKLHNARSILADYRQVGDRLWERFAGGRDGTLWYYRALVDAYRASAAPAPLVDELGRVVSEIERLVGRAG